MERFEAEVLSAVDYYPFGMMLPDRQYYASNDSSDYRFGFGGQIKDDEISGAGNSLSFQFRIYDSRLGKFLSVDPLEMSYPNSSPYVYAQNRVIDGIDLEGTEWVPSHKWSDFVDQETLKKQLGADYIAGSQITYSDLYRIRAPQIARKYYDEGASYDCFDFVVLILIDFAAENKLPVQFVSSEKPETNISLDQSNDYTYESGKWKEYYTRVAQLRAVELSENDIIFNDLKWDDIEPGDLIATAWAGGGHHAQMVSFVETKTVVVSTALEIEFDIKSCLVVIQGSLDNQSKPTKIHITSYKLPDLKDGYHNTESYSRSSYDKDNGGLSAREWNFEYFDNLDNDN